MARSGWLVAAIATGLYAALVLIRGRLDRAAVLVAAVFGAACILLSFNVLGARLRHDIEVSRYGPELTAPIPGADSEQFRGGMDLSGRPLIWDASLDAIRARPVVGWGPGTNAQAIAPYLTGEAARFRGLTSHNTWLRAVSSLASPAWLPSWRSAWHRPRSSFVDDGCSPASAIAPGQRSSPSRAGSSPGRPSNR